MPIVILKGNQSRLFDISGSMKPGGKPMVMSDTQIKKHKGVIERILDEEVKKPSANADKDEVKKYTKVELIAMNKAEQIDLLNELKITKIPRLEAGRVNAILEAQK